MHRLYTRNCCGLPETVMCKLKFDIHQSRRRKVPSGTFWV